MKFLIFEGKWFNNSVGRGEFLLEWKMATLSGGDDHGGLDRNCIGRGESEHADAYKRAGNRAGR